MHPLYHNWAVNIKGYISSAVTSVVKIEVHPVYRISVVNIKGVHPVYRKPWSRSEQRAPTALPVFCLF